MANIQMEFGQVGGNIKNLFQTIRYALNFKKEISQGASQEMLNMCKIINYLSES